MSRPSPNSRDVRLAARALDVWLDARGFGLGTRQTPDSSTPSSKVLISRASQLRSPGNGRVKKACIDCRKRKTKCNGRHPCSRCASLGITCVYADGRREIIDSRLKKLEKQVQAYDQLLKEIQPRLDSQNRDLIARTQAQVRCQPSFLIVTLYSKAEKIVFGSRSRSCASRTCDHWSYPRARLLHGY